MRDGDETRQLLTNVVADNYFDVFTVAAAVAAAAVASRIPLWGSGGGAAALAWIPGLQAPNTDGRRIGFAVVSPDYFATLGTRIVRGRAISDRDHETAAPVAILNQSAANLLWPGQDALGRHFRWNGPKGPDVEVVGIAQDGRYLDLTEPQRAYMFLPVYQEARLFGSRWGADVLIVRSTGDAAAHARAVRALVSAIDANVTVLSTTTMEQHVRAALYGDRLMMQLATTMGVLGLILAAIGLFGVVSYSVTRRTREIGVRIALGASRHGIMRLVLTRASIRRARCAAIRSPASTSSASLRATSGGTRFPAASRTCCSRRSANTSPSSPLK